MDASIDRAEPARPPGKTHQGPLLLIGAFKLVKSTLLVALGIWALKLVHSDVAAQAARWIEWLNLDPGNRHVMTILSKLGGLDDHRLREIGAVSFFYAGLFLVEGTGLCLRKRWAEYMTTILTASALPFEMLGIVEHVTIARVALLLANFAILAYLIRILRPDHRAKQATGAR